MLLYIHVPFCVRKCGYCAFHSGLFSLREAGRYVDLVVMEMAWWAKTLGPAEVQTVYLGGGTPSLLTPYQVEAILAAAHRHFAVSPDAEITLEANPESALADGFLSEIRKLGVNRLSLGVQSLRDDLLFLLGRPHDSVQACRAVDAARKAGFANLSLDMMWGLPGQSLAIWLEDLARSVDLGPDHLSCYGLTLENGTPLARRAAAGELGLPDDEEEASMFEQGAAFLGTRGFEHYEISNFARPGCKSRHNFGYWTGQDYLGLGPSAVSTLGEYRWTNPEGLEAYSETVQGNGKGRAVETLHWDTRRREQVMLAMRTGRGLDLKNNTALTGMDFSGLLSAVEPLRSGGLVRLRSGHLQLTRNGMLVSNSVIEHLLDVIDRMHDTGNV
ncbi:MAG: radical SAM family heme chaperone HemW [Desulfovibrionales bacterium]|nr:radical SAM family heme chaperone HemW [Desulfovibrionales bacterium]